MLSPLRVSVSPSTSGAAGVPLHAEARWHRFLFRQQLRGARYFDTTRVNTKDLPLDTEDAIIGLTAGDEEIALLDLGVRSLSRFSDSQLDVTHERTQDRFTRRVRRLAEALILGSLSLLAWHRLTRDAIKQHVVQQALLGGRGTIDDLKRVDGIVRRETDYLARFADQIAREGKGSLGNKVLSRATLYGGSARAVYYREREAVLPLGYTIEYVSRDDDNTCSPCANAAGFYLPGSGPYPGDVCLGHSHCRCVRIPRFGVRT